MEREIKGLADLIEHFALVDDGVVLTTAGIYVAGCEFHGHDMDSMDPVDAMALASRIASRFTFGGGWTVHCNLIRGEHFEYCDSSEWPDPVSELIDSERRQRFTLPGQAHRLSRYFLSLSYEPAMTSAKGAARWMFAADDSDHDTAAARHLAVFKSRLNEFAAVLQANLSGVRRLRSFTARVGELDQTFCEFLQFVRRCISGEDFRFAVPGNPTYLNQYLAPSDFVGGARMQLGDPLNALMPGKFIAVMAIDGFPAGSFAGILRELDAIPADFRFSMAGQILDARDAEEEHAGNRKSWKSRKTSTSSKISQQVVTAADVDTYAADLEMDAQAASKAAAHQIEINMRFSAKAVVMANTWGEVGEILGMIRIAVQKCGFQCRIETSVNSVAAWLSSFPGMHKLEKRQTLVTSANYAHMMPLSAPWRGHDTNPSPYFPPKSPPLFYGVTNGGTPYRFNPYVSDVGHTLIVGPNGAGKTTFMGLEIASFLRYRDAQVVVFDKKQTLYTLTRALGGSWYNLSPDGGPESRLCPLQYLETEGQRKAGARVIELLVSQAGLPVSVDVTNSIRDAIKLIAQGNGGRSLTDFCMAVDDDAIAAALERYCDGLLDGDHDNLSLSTVTTFEVDQLYQQDKATMNGALFCIAGRLRDRLSSSRPTLMCVDEFTQALSHEYATNAFGEFLLEGRKMNLKVSFAVQEISKLRDSPLEQPVLQQCLTKILLPNPQATASAEKTYDFMGLNAVDREVIANAQPKAEYYHVSPDGKRLIGLELGQVALSFIAASSERDRARVDALIEQYPYTWQVQWLRERGLPDWAGALEQQMVSIKEERYLCTSGD